MTLKLSSNSKGELNLESKKECSVTIFTSYCTINLSTIITVVLENNLQDSVLVKIWDILAQVTVQSNLYNLV